MSIFEEVQTLKQELRELKSLVSFLPDWLPISSISYEFGYSSSNSLRKLLLNGNFEPNVDFRQNGRFYEISFKTYLNLKRFRKNKKKSDKILMATSVKV